MDMQGSSGKESSFLRNSPSLTTLPSGDARLDLSVKPRVSIQKNRPAGVDRRLTSEQEQAMIEHLPIVHLIARRIRERLPQNIAIDDLYSAGVIGLLDALYKFDPSKHVKFATYAQFRIRGAILDSLRAIDWCPRHLRRQGRQIEHAIHLLMGRLGRAPSEIEIAQELGLDVPAYQQILGDLRGLEISSLNADWSEDGDEEIENLANRQNPLDHCLHSELRQSLADAIKELPERERLVVTLYYYEELSMREIGLVLGVVESRVSQIHASAVLRLRASLRLLKKQTSGLSRLKEFKSARTNFPSE
jgi:RNA polymerase sigma factor FliA